MKTLVYHIPIDNAEELSATIVVAAKKSRYSRYIYAWNTPKCSDFHASEMRAVYCSRWKKLRTLTLTYVPFSFLHVLLNWIFSFVSFFMVFLWTSPLEESIPDPTLLHDFESSLYTLPLLVVQKSLTETSCILFINIVY